MKNTGLIQLVTGLIIGIGLLNTSLQAETGPLGFGDSEFKQELETDRPDFTEGTQTIDPGHFQLESGYTYYDDSRDAHTLPEFLLRSGMMEDLELRVSWLGYVFENHANGTSDMSLGFKHRIYQEDGMPTVSYIFELGLPVGSDNQSAEEVEPALKVLWSYDASDLIGFSGNLNIASRNGDIERFTESSASFSTAVSLTDTLGMYTEYFGIYPAGGARGELDEHYINAGLTLATSVNSQLDVRTGFGLNSDAADMFSGIGFTFRI